MDLQLTEEQQLILKIVETALTEENLKFSYITTWHEFRYRAKQARATKMLIKVLKASARRLFKSYCTDVIAGVSDITKLTAHSQLLDVVAFYERDLTVLKQMTAEYDEYLGDCGNFFHAIFGGEREI